MASSILVVLFVFVAALRAAHPDLLLIRRAVAHDGGALTRLARRLMPIIAARVCLYLAPGRSVASRDRDDLAQEVWLALLADEGRLLLSWDADRGLSLEGYVGLLTRRVVWQARRDAGRLRRGGDKIHEAYDDAVGDPAPDPEREADARDRLTRVVTHLREVLPEKGRVVFELLYGDGLDPKEAAAAMGVNLQVVYNWQHRIRKEARELLTD